MNIITDYLPYDSELLKELNDPKLWEELSSFDADINTNPFELGLDRLVNLDNDNKFIGKEALIKIKEKGIKRKQVGLIIDCNPLSGPNTTFWPIEKDGKTITSKSRFLQLQPTHNPSNFSFKCTHRQIISSYMASPSKT